jgi:PAS domain S-box-containing protein
MLQDVAQESRNVQNAADEATLLSYMKTRVASLEEVRTISITDPKGKIIWTTLPQVLGFDSSERPYFTDPLTAQDRDQLFIHGPITAVSGSVVLFVARTKALANAPWDGVIVSSLPPAFFASILESVKPQQDGFAALLGKGGVIMARSPDQKKYAGTSVADGPAFSTHMASGQQMTRSLVTTATEGKRNLVVIRTSEFTELMVAVGWAEDTVMEPWRTQSMIKGLALLLLAVIGVLLLRRFSHHENEILKQRNFARQLIETANVMVVGTDLNGRIKLFNAAAQVLTGYQQKDVHDRFWMDMLTSDDDLTELRNGFKSGEPIESRFVASVTTATGRNRVIAWQNSVIADNPDIAFMAFGLDITERLQAEQELDASRRFLKAIADNMPGMIGYWDADLRCLFANKVYLDWFGKHPEDIIGQSMHNLLNETLFSLNEPYIRGALRGERQTFERTLIKADGSTGYTWAHYIPDISAEGDVLGFFVLINDISPLKKTELALREVSGRLEIATKAGGIGVWSLDVETQALAWDERMFSLYDSDPDITVPVYQTWRNACHPDDRERAEAEFAAALDGGPAFSTEFRVLFPQGKIRHIKAAATVIKNDSGDAIRMVGVNWDVTPLREGEQALKAAQEKAEKASQAKSEFLANMSHEIRTPMNAILGLTHLLERSNIPPDQRSMISKIGVAGRSLLTIINDILDFSKVEAGQMELDEAEFQLNDILDAISTIMSINAKTKDLELVISAAPGVPGAFIGDAMRLQQVLINLVSNAIKFTDRGDVSLRVDQIGTEESGKIELRFAVQDSGIGIAADVIPKLFNAFTQADSSTTRRFGGSGLGLAICKRLVTLMGGELGAQSIPGQGSTFWFTVPLLAVAHSTPHHALEHIQGLEVLIADDHDIARDSIAATASSLGWLSETVDTGTEALKRVTQRQTSQSLYDVLILDWKMPDMDGLAVSQAIRETEGLKDTSIVIMVTAYNREILLTVPGAETIDAVLVKPVTASSLYNAVIGARARRTGTEAIIAEIASQSPGLRLAGARVLLVEDNSINQDVAKRVLELEGAVVTVADDGQQSLNALTASPAAYDVVLMDIHMPVMDGYQATHHIRHQLGLKDLPVIALTAGALDSERASAEHAGMNDFIAKPFDVDIMVQCILRHVTISEEASPSLLAPISTPLQAPAKTIFDVAIPGINMRQATLRIGGDDVLFLSLLKRVVSEFSGTIDKVHAHLAAGEPEQAARLLHTLRGATGNIAANDVATLASTAEAVIKDGKEASVTRAALDQLEQALTSLLQAISASGALEATENETPQTEALTTLNLDDAKALLLALRDRSMTAMGLFDSLRPSLTAALGTEAAAEIAKDVENLRFKPAAEKLDAALGKM